VELPRAAKSPLRTMAISRTPAQLREELEARGSIFRTPSIAKSFAPDGPAEFQRQANHLVHTLQNRRRLLRSFIMTEKELIGVRDPHGFRPLCIGKIDDAGSSRANLCAGFDPR